MNTKIQVQESRKDRTCEECERKIKPGSLYFRLVEFGKKLIQHDLCLACGSMVNSLPENSISNADTFEELMHEAEWYDRDRREDAAAEAMGDLERGR